MGCAASVPDEDKQNKKGKGKGKAPEAATVAAAPVAEPSKASETPSTVNKAADYADKPKEEPKAAEQPPPAAAAPVAEAAKPTESAPHAAEPAKPAGESSASEPHAKHAEPEPAPPAVAEHAKPHVEAPKEEPKHDVKPEVKEEHKAEEPKLVGETKDAQPTRKAKIAVVYYSTYGHILQLAEKITEGAKSAGADVDIYQVRETLPEEVLEKMHAPPKASHPTIELSTTLVDYDAFLFGIPTRYGIWPSQWKTFLDATGQVWQQGGFHGKMAGVFTSTASQHGGIETTALNAISFFAHHGITFVPFGYAKAFAELTVVTELVGGSPYGAGTIAGGDGSRQPSEIEKKICLIQGETFAATVTKHFSH